MTPRWASRRRCGPGSPSSGCPWRCSSPTPSRADPVPFRWGGFSTRWFAALAANDRLLEAAWLSLRVAAGAATLAVLLGGATGWVLARHGPFAGRAALGALAGAPLVLPEVVTGLSLLLFFVALEGATGWPEGRGALTVLLAHATLGTAYVAVVIQSRLASAERDLEEAARDLGAGPATAFATVTLPLTPQPWPPAGSSPSPSPSTTWCSPPSSPAPPAPPCPWPSSPCSAWA